MSLDIFNICPVWEVAGLIMQNYGKGELRDVSDPKALHEANLLILDITKAKFKLGWEPRTNIEDCCDLTADWYKRYLKEDVYNLDVEQIDKFIHKKK